VISHGAQADRVQVKCDLLGILAASDIDEMRSGSGRFSKYPAQAWSFFLGTAGMNLKAQVGAVEGGDEYQRFLKAQARSTA
jgi:hypothetical protein